MQQLESEVQEDDQGDFTLANDTCDSCGVSSKAYVWALMPSGNELTYCAHHGARWHDGLLTQGAVIRDLTHMVTEE